LPLPRRLALFCPALYGSIKNPTRFPEEPSIIKSPDLCVLKGRHVYNPRIYPGVKRDPSPKAPTGRYIPLRAAVTSLRYINIISCHYPWMNPGVRLRDKKTDSFFCLNARNIRPGVPDKKKEKKDISHREHRGHREKMQ